MRFRNSLILRSLALVIAVAVCFPTIGFGAASNDGSSTNAVKLLNALGIMQNDEYTGNFWDDTPVKRSEMAKIICSLFNLEESAEQSPVFSDVRDRDRACVETAVRNGYMKGYGDGRFGADDYITANQLVKTFVCFLHAETMADASGGYPTGYITVARRLGLLKNLSVIGENPVRRIEVAKMIYNTLHADMLQLVGVSDGSVIYNTREGENFLSQSLDIYIGEGILRENAVTTLNRVGGLGENLIKVGEDIYRDTNGLADDLLGCSVTVYYHQPNDEIGEVIYISEDYSNECITVNDEDIISVSDSSVKYYENGSREKKINISSVADMIYNGVAVEFDADLMNVQNGYVKFVKNSGTSFNVVLISEFDTYIVDKINETDGKVLLKYGETAVDLKDTDYRVFRNGEKVTLSELHEDDVVLVAVSSNTASDKAIRIEASSETAMGTVEGFKTQKGTEYVTISGKRYEVSEYCKKLESEERISTLKIGDSGSFMLDARGKVVFYSVNAGGSGVGYLIQGCVSDNGFDKSLSVKIFNESGEIAVYTANDKLKINDVRQNVKDIINNISIISRFNTPQLVQFDAKDGVLNEIVFANDEYSANDFSKDVDGTLSCSTATVLNHIYCVSSDTRVFIVPDIQTDDKAYYGIDTGSYFVRDRSYTGSLYDVAADNSVPYAVVQVKAEGEALIYADPVMLVEDIVEILDDEDNVVKAIEGWDESGKNVTYILKNQNNANTISSGDVIHFRLNNENYINDFTVVKNSSTKYNLSTLKSTTVTVYGEVGTLASDRIMVATKSVTNDMTPLEMAKSVSANSSVVYKFILDEDKIVTIDFSEIERGDKVFACVEGSNKTRLLVIYE